MKYILMMNTMKAGQGIPQWPGKDLQVHIAFMKNLNKELRDSGELVSAEGLSFPEQACLVRAVRKVCPLPMECFPTPRSSLLVSGSSTARSGHIRLPRERPLRPALAEDR